jgi:hypothetical protein
VRKSLFWSRVSAPMVRRCLLAVLLLGLVSMKVAGLVDGQGAAGREWALAASLVEFVLACGVMSRWWRIAVSGVFVLMIIFMVATRAGMVDSCGCLGLWFSLSRHHRIFLAASLAALAAWTLAAPGRPAQIVLTS